MLSLGESHCRSLPLKPLLHVYREAGLPSISGLHQLPGLGSRFAAILGASARFLYPGFLDRASDSDFRDAILRFHEAVVPLPVHGETVRRRAGLIRHGLAHLLHGRDPLPVKLEACLDASGSYRIPGLGPAFWSALIQASDPSRHPGWTRKTLHGLDRLRGERIQGNRRPATVYRHLRDLHARIRGHLPEMTALHIDYFLSLLSSMRGRDLFAGTPVEELPQVETLRDKLRATSPTRQRLKERGQAIARAQQGIERGLASGLGSDLAEALALGDPNGYARSSVHWDRDVELLRLWIGRLWESDEPYPLLARFWEADPIPGAGVWLPTTVLHIRDPQSYLPQSDLVRSGLAQLDDGIDNGDPPAERYRLANEAGIWLRDRFGLHPLELPELLKALGERSLARSSDEPSFHGFCADTFHFLQELSQHNRRDWMEQSRERYHFAVREPLTELCHTLTTRFIEPVVERTHGWPLDTLSRPGHALTSVCKNVFGRTSPYTSTLWITFCLADQGRQEAQLFVRLSPEGLRFGLRLGRGARMARALLARNLDLHGAFLLQALQTRGTLDMCLFRSGEECTSQERITDLAGLRAWAQGRSLEVSVEIDRTKARIDGEDLVAQILQVFDQVLPLFAASIESDLAETVHRMGGDPYIPGYGEGEFRRQTYLGNDWLGRTRDLLSLKKQLILQGVPGTGKTHVARCLARLLTGGRDEAIRLVQFHPAYSYEEFVEGIRVRSVDVDGRQDVIYPVEEGLLCAFAARAASRPSQPHVLIIDELNRGNLPRIFGELLYLLEYRGQAVELPYSRRDFRLPGNLILLATMNARDRSLVVLDQALRRRFSFMEMEPDNKILASWLADFPPAAGQGFVGKVLALFDKLNTRLLQEVGTHARIGHSFFMVPGLDEARLHMIWHHQVRPLLEDVFVSQPGRIAAYDALLEFGKRRSSQPAPVSCS